MPKVFRILLTIAVILIVISAIFFFSDQSGTVSHQSSRKVALIVSEGIIKMSPTTSSTKNDINIVAKVIEYPIRKIAHVLIYFILGLIVYIGLRFVLQGYMRSCYAFGVILLVFLVACADEINQYFSGGRGASFSDVLLDTFGGTLGIYFFHIIKDFIMHMRSLFRKKAK